MNNKYRILLILELIPKLGYYNFAYAVWYKIGMKLGLFKYRFPILKFNKKICFRPSVALIDYNPMWLYGLRDQADRIMAGEFTWFSIHRFNTGETPQWFRNPFNGREMDNPLVHWTEIGDFNSGIGDIKIIWELSRFDWLTTLARAHKVTGEKQYLERLNFILNDWMKKNPLNQGPNWMCGQETSIRLMKILTTISILDIEESSNEGLHELVACHVDRINANIQYGVIQDNNHGTSEAAGLYIGALWLINRDYQVDKFEKLKNKGRVVLEDRIKNLIQKNGSFSQRSCNYHRVVVDTLSFVLHMMSIHQEPDFGVHTVERLIKLGEWQYKMTFGKDGQAPNFGSNDGAMIETLHSKSYEDFRISTQLFFALLLKRRVYEEVELSEPIYWRSDITFGQLLKCHIDKPPHEILDDHVVILRNNRATVFIKLPDDTFRPGNDAGHIDLWLDGVNILRDSGSYSYNAGMISEEFKSVASHNTIQFGSHEQMPKISRFLYGAWIKNECANVQKEKNEISISFNYQDFAKNKHYRSLTLYENQLVISDKVVTNEEAVANFHLNPQFEQLKVRLQSNQVIMEAKSKFSKYYMKYAEGPMKNIRIKGDSVKTTVDWSTKKEAE